MQLKCWFSMNILGQSSLVIVCFCGNLKKKIYVTGMA